MKFLPLILRNVLRNKVRSIFTGSSIAVSLFLVVLLYSFLTVQDETASATRAYNRLMVTHIQGLTGTLPIADVDRIRSMEGVKSAVPFSWFGGKYREEKIPFAQFATDANYLLDVLQEYQLPPDQLEAWKADKTGCVVGAVIARNHDWKIGDKIVLKGDIYPCNLELTVRGIYNGPSFADREQLWYHFEYFDEALKKFWPTGGGNAGIIMLRATSAGVMPELMHRIDSQFASSDAPVRAMTERQFQQSFMEMMGNVRGFIRYTSIAVVISLLCVAANTMAMSLRERTREIALLKAIGFSQTSILSLFLSESVALGALGGAVGALGVKLLFQTVDFSRWLPGLSSFYVPWITALEGVALAAAIGLLSGVIPAWRAAHVSVLDGLRKIV